MKVWIVCRPCIDSYYHGHPTGMVFANHDAAKAYLLENNNVLDNEDDYALYLLECDLIEATTPDKQTTV